MTTTCLATSLSPTPTHIVCYKFSETSTTNTLTSRCSVNCYARTRCPPKKRTCLYSLGTEISSKCLQPTSRGVELCTHKQTQTCYSISLRYEAKSLFVGVTLNTVLTHIPHPQDTPPVWAQSCPFQSLHVHCRIA